ncbi:hypothetical protein BGX34_002626, partial [Mortierella sp. NVP85]
MVFGSIVTSPRSSLSPRQTLDLAKAYLEVAYHATDPDVALVLCHDTEISLHQAKKAVKRAEDQNVIKDIAVTYIDLGNLLEKRGHANEAKVSYKKAGKLGVNVQDSSRLTTTSRPSSTVGSFKGSSLPTGTSQSSSSVDVSPDQRKQHRDISSIPAHIFAENVRPPVAEYKLPEPDERLSNTPQLAGCLYLLQPNRSPDDILEPAAQNWLHTISKDADEQTRLRTIGTEVIRAFKRDEFKDTKVVAE